jgi:hypothetical protein
MFVSACASAGFLRSQDHLASPTHATLSATQLLQKSKVAMAKLQSMHFELQAARQPETPSGASAADILKALQPLPSISLVRTQANGDIVAPDLSRIDVTKEIIGATSGGSAGKFTIHAIIQRDNVYHADEESNWYVISKEHLQATNKISFSIDAGLPQINAMIKLALQHGALYNAGETTIGGKKLQHIQATFHRDAFQALQTIDVENRTWPELSANQFTNITDTADFWIDSNTGYVYQLTNKLQLDPILIQTFNFQCSAFNRPISIQIPTNAIPVDNVNQIPHLEEI